MTHIRNAQNHKNVTCSCVPNCFYLFYEHGCQGGMLKIMKLRTQSVYMCFVIEVTREECSNPQKISFSAICSRLSSFSQIFGQIKEWDTLELHEIIRISHLVPRPMVFNLLCHLGRPVGVLKLTKNAQF